VLPRQPLAVPVLSRQTLPNRPLHAQILHLTTIELAGPPDANGWRTLDLEFDTLEEARAGILQLGASVEVLEPAELREAIRETIGEMATLYQAACPIADFNRPHRVDTVL
jgi:predicted DNA-binding transcriptional regulator YafY